ncbi:hypothetical protein BIFBIF_00818 [Bifidobacterium bifidum ATCC 29521 = JCM 1255 = DSM 20456]|nr:hypothetical protein BIFBIF_00818 [Bifidobacterium bifidum ATCC 29521 = JCM 1255 = DSM 20456]
MPGEGDFDAGRRRGEFDDITWRILAVVATPGVFFGVATTARIRLSGVPRIQATTQARRILRQGAPPMP